LGRKRSLRFQQLHTKATTGSGSQTGNGAAGGGWRSPAHEPDE
jgi:hypothetical protein